MVNFCTAILILKVEKDRQHYQCIMLYYFQKGKNATAMAKKKKVCAVCGEGPMTDGTSQKWFVRFLGPTDTSAK